MSVPRPRVEGADPRRWLLGRRFAEQGFRLGQQAGAGGSLAALGIAARFHSQQARPEIGARDRLLECGLSLPGECDGFFWLMEVGGQMAHAAKDMGAELVVTAYVRKGQRTAEVLLGSYVTAGVVGHPAGHLGESGGGCEDCGALAAVVAAEEPGADVGLEVGDDAGVQMSASDPEVCGPECRHCRRIGTSGGKGAIAAHGKAEGVARRKTFGRI